MSTGIKIKLPGFKLDKSGKPVRNLKALDVSTRLKRQAASSKRIRPAKGRSGP